MTETQGSHMPTTPPSISLEQMIELLNNVAVLTARVEQLTSTVKQQDDEIRKLVALAEQGKGSVWMLMAVGGVVGAFLSNAKTILTAFLR